MAGLLGALADPQFRADVGQGLLGAVNRGAVAGTVGAPVDMATGLLNAALMGGGVLGHKAGLLRADQLPRLIESPIGGSEWIGDQMQRAGIVGPQRNAVAEGLASVAVPTAMMRAGPAVYAAEKAIGGMFSGHADGKIGASFASKSPRMNNPKPTTQRPFHDDYPKGAPGPDGSILTVDIDGRPIHTDAIVFGRRVAGGMDEGGGVAEARRVAGGLGFEIRPVASGDIGGDAGRFVAGRGTDGERQSIIKIADGLDANQAAHVLQHELGHGIESLTFGAKIPQTGAAREAALLYSDLNSTRYVPKGKIGATPESQNYKPSEWDAERMAEAIRAYQQDPNYVKTVAPKLAARIREYVNTNPNLNRVVHFNSAAGAGLIGLLGLQDVDSNGMPLPK